MRIEATDKIALHRVSYHGNQKNRSYYQLYVGPNPYGPQGGTGGRVVDATCIAEGPGHWVTYLHDMIVDLIDIGERPLELDLPIFIEWARYDSHYGKGAHLVRDAKTIDELEGLLNVREKIIGNVAFMMLKDKIAKLLVKQCRKEDLILLHGDPRLTPAAEALLAKRMRS